MKEDQIVKSVSYLQKCFQLILVQFVTLEAIYTLYNRMNKWKYVFKH